MKLRPLHDRVIVKRLEEEKKSAGGILIPDSAAEKPSKGEVIAVGPGKRSEHTGEIIPIGVSVGDTVLYSKYGGTEVTIDAEDVLVLSARDVLAIVKK